MHWRLAGEWPEPQHRGTWRFMGSKKMELYVPYMGYKTTIVPLLITPLITTQEPPSICVEFRGLGLGVGCRELLEVVLIARKKDR